MLNIRRPFAGPPEAQLWGLEKLQAYVSFVKTLQPELTPDSEEVLSRYYQMQRQIDSRQAARTTIRLLESLVRLAQAHARIMCHVEVTTQDAVMAVVMMESSKEGTSLVGAASR